MTERARRLLVFNCHEAWVHQLEGLGAELDVLIDLPGRYTRGWDERMRPVPSGARLVRLEQVAAEQRDPASPAYDAAVCHSVTDLLDVRWLAAPKLVVLHVTVEGRIAAERTSLPPDHLRAALRRFLDLTGGHAMAVSPMKARSWGVTEDVVPSGVDVDAYPPWTGELELGVRVANQISLKREVLALDFFEAAFRSVPVRLIGHNPDLRGVGPAPSWEELKRTLARHRFYVHTAHPRFEDGFNMAVLEAMAAGLPVVGNRHPTSPVVHGESGFLSDDPAELGALAQRLLDEPELAAEMGRAARRVVAERFPASAFRAGFTAALERARARFAERVGA